MKIIKQTILNAISTSYLKVVVTLGITLVLSLAIGNTLMNVEPAFAGLDEVDFSPQWQQSDLIKTPNRPLFFFFYFNISCIQIQNTILNNASLMYVFTILQQFFLFQNDGFNLLHIVRSRANNIYLNLCELLKLVYCISCVHKWNERIIWKID